MKIRQRGSGWSIKLVYNLYRIFGYKFIYYLMYPVSYFYYLKAANVKEALKIYYSQIGKEFTSQVHHDHLRHFAICMCDRFISLVTPQKYTFEIENKKILLEKLHQGGILLLSHYGGWAVAANCFGKFDIKINVVMQEALIQSIKEIEEQIKNNDLMSHMHIIDTAKGGIRVTLDIANALRDGELVAMMADRATGKKNAQGVEFFKKEGFFNKNPFEIAYKMQKPLIAIFFRYEKPQTYSIDFEIISMQYDEKMDKAVAKCMRLYAQRFEKNIEIYPQGWFNFYDFWGEK